MQRSAAKNGVAGVLSGAGFKVSDIGGPGSVAQGGADISQAAFSKNEHKGKLEAESALGEAPSDPQSVYNDAEKASRELPEIRTGKGREFVDKFAISYIDKTGGERVKAFYSFERANEFAGQVNGGWPEAMERGGYITLFRTSTYAKIRVNRHDSYQKLHLSNMDSVIYNLAHEGVHTRYGGSHDQRLEAISFGAVEAYRKRSK